ncbi:hypothetical protein M1437_04450 [Patescibacteria group bacterium]|nr:hypothetical protein [Patescibacteria group bacterium]
MTNPEIKKFIGPVILATMMLTGCASRASAVNQPTSTPEATPTSAPREISTPLPTVVPADCDLGPEGKGYMSVNGIPYGFVRGGSGLDYNRMCTTPEYLKNN